MGGSGHGARFVERRGREGGGVEGLLACGAFWCREEAMGVGVVKRRWAEGVLTGRRGGLAAANRGWLSSRV